jgi:hypothetical protein
MARKRQPSGLEAETAPEGFLLGKEIAIEAMDHRIAITPNGHATYYLGFLNSRLEDPYIYNITVATHQKDGRSSRKFVELRKGGLFLSSFLWDRSHYKILEDRVLRLPVGPHSSYGVYHRESWELDEDLTRQLFGSTQSELEEFLTAFHSAIRFPASEQRVWKPFTTTFSKSRGNSCHLTELFIPQGFPFIRLGETQYFGGHISLSGFYRQLALLCHYYRVGNEIRGEGFFNLLVQQGAKPETIIRLATAGFNEGGQPLLEPSLLREFGATALRI